ncbi:MAG: hypothetical protein JWO32_2048 [Bacteroidetes bacterium]|nr:hypothetical protein [Bacteroidota bacterium]
MEWWYKSDKYPVSSHSMTQMKNHLQKKFIEGNMLNTTSLFDDENYFYVRTSNNIYLHTFLFEHGFDELYDGKPNVELNLLWGTF